MTDSAPGLRTLSALLLAAVAAACAVGSEAPPDVQGVLPPGAVDGGGLASVDASAAPPTVNPDPPRPEDAGGDGATSPPCARAHPSDACAVLAQCGCSATQTCDLDASGAPSCVPAGANARGASCGSTSDCQRGLTCRFGVCRPFCGAAGVACDESGACYALPGGAANVCTSPCELHAPATACGASTCAWDSGSTDCRAPGPKGVRASCTTTADCGAGLACAPTVLGNMCLRWCRIGAGECSTFTLCTSVFGANAPRSADGKEYGVCP